jgi:hypothetical protein
MSSIDEALHVSYKVLLTVSCSLSNFLMLSRNACSTTFSQFDALWTTAVYIHFNHRIGGK